MITQVDCHVHCPTPVTALLVNRGKSPGVLANYLSKNPDKGVFYLGHYEIPEIPKGFESQVLSGQESHDTHIVGVGIKEVLKQKEPQGVLEEILEQGGLAIIHNWKVKEGEQKKTSNRAYLKEICFDDLESLREKYDGRIFLELNSLQWWNQYSVRRNSRKFGLPLAGGSDTVLLGSNFGTSHIELDGVQDIREILYDPSKIGKAVCNRAVLAELIPRYFAAFIEEVMGRKTREEIAGNLFNKLKR